MGKPKSHRLTLFLIKPEFKNWEDCIKEGVVYTSYNISQRFDMLGKIIIGEVKGKRPRWISFLQEASESELEELYNTSPRALLFVRTEDSLFAIAFGYGRYMLKDECYERDFGFKVTLNLVDPSKLRSIDVANVEELTLQTRKQSSRSSSLDVFGLDILSDLVRAVTGEPSDKTLAIRITGKDALVFSSKMSFKDLKEKLARFLAAYNSDDYKRNFPWIDNISEIKEPALLEDLNLRLVEALKNREFDKIHIAPPELIEWTEIEGFNYLVSHLLKKKEKTPDIYPDLEIEDFINLIQVEKLDIEKLKNCKVLVKIAEGEELIPKWGIYETLVFEVPLNNRLYVLTMGKWFKIETNFAQRVTEFVKSIPDAKIDMPDCKATENEDEYNRRVAEEVESLILMHEELISSETKRDKIELCDLFSEKGQFIHVKVKGSSSVLSHLFAQGRVSAESFLEDHNFRREARKKIVEGKNKEHLAKFFPDSKPDPSKYEIIFAFIDSSDKELHESLPFFTKVNFMQTVRILSLLGFKVSKKKIRKVKSKALFNKKILNF